MGERCQHKFRIRPTSMLIIEINKQRHCKKGTFHSIIILCGCIPPSPARGVRVRRLLQQMMWGGEAGREEMLCLCVCVQLWWAVGQHIAKLLILTLQPATHAAWIQIASMMVGRVPQLGYPTKQYWSVSLQPQLFKKTHHITIFDISKFMYWKIYLCIYTTKLLCIVHGSKT